MFCDLYSIYISNCSNVQIYFKIQILAIKFRISLFLSNNNIHIIISHDKNKAVM